MVRGSGHRPCALARDVRRCIDRRALDPDSIAVARPVHLAAACVGDHQDVSTGAHADGIEAAGAVDRNVQSVTDGSRGGHPDPQSGERARPAAHHDSIQVGHRLTRLSKRGKYIRGESFRVRTRVNGHVLGQHVLAGIAAHHSRRHRRGRGVQRQDDHWRVHCQVAVRTSESSS